MTKAFKKLCSFTMKNNNYFKLWMEAYTTSLITVVKMWSISFFFWFHLLQKLRTYKCERILKPASVSERQKCSHESQVPQWQLQILNYTRGITSYSNFVSIEKNARKCKRFIIPSFKMINNYQRDLQFLKKHIHIENDQENQFSNPVSIN